VHNQTTSPGALVYYTDGSRKNGLVGMGIYGPSIRYFEALGSTPTIFQVEIHAKNVCLTEGEIESKHIYIMSHVSQSGGFKGTKGSHLQVSVGR
jgi:hypothetical protein